MARSCIAYVRISADLTVGEQRADIEAFAAIRDLPILRWFVEAAESFDARLRDRVALLDAIGAARAERADLLVARRDLAGDELACVMIEHALGKRGCSLLAVESDPGRGEPERARIRTAVADFESVLLGTSLRAVWMAKRARGEHNGKVPYGFHAGPDGRKLEPDEREATIIRVARHMRGMGHMHAEIAAFLTKNGARTRAGTPFNATRVGHFAEGVRKGELLPHYTRPTPLTATWDEAVLASAETASALDREKAPVPERVGPEERQPAFWETRPQSGGPAPRTVLLVTAVEGMDILTLGAASVLWDDVHVRDVEFARLATELPAALVQSAVIVVVKGEKEASQAFGLGADAVLRAGEIFQHNVDRALAIASARAAARDVELSEDPTAPGLALLQHAFGEEVGRALGDLPTGAGERGAFDSARPPAPASPIAAVEAADLAGADVKAEIEDVVRLFHDRLFQTTAVSLVEEEGGAGLRAAIPREVMRFVVAMQLAVAADARKASRRASPVIVRVREEEEDAIVEVEFVPCEPGELDPEVDFALFFRAQIRPAAMRLALAGGELLVDHGRTSTCLRATFPVAEHGAMADFGAVRERRPDSSTPS